MTAILAILALASCSEVDDTAAHIGEVYACRGVETGIFFEVCVGPGETPEDVYRAIEDRTGYHCGCSLACRETFQACDPETLP